MNARRLLFAAGGIFSLVSLGVVIGVIRPQVEAWLRGAPREATLLHADSSCNPVGGQCTARSESIAITLRLEDALRPLKRFQVEVDVADAYAQEMDSVAVQFSMVGMNMGVNRFGLDNTAKRKWGGFAILPVCATGRADWLVNVEAQRGRDVYVAEFAMTAIP